ncbi:hypothetical protein PRIPAC_95252 [Pristionchus pacificus]|uniref:CWH43-like N-terminal domain-containing protein n=1 Tax=Pristionchus pacificus TaxID=54126 RepID=A0A2A6D0V1_PRIPA|nr:hypothetical protein PRIPAC_95252 [Pristionchus pacificus]|eukprot:PDM84035.1 hypothetical protein PRIPAC_34227 [Pristionchus pacificus]
MVKLDKPMKWSLEAPSKLLPVAPIVFAAAVLPFLAFLISVIYTFLFARERLDEWTMPDCPHLKTSIPPLSYIIGEWEPQRLIMLLALYVHIPARFIVIYMYFPVFTWYPQNAAMALSSFLETLGFVGVIVLHVNLGFEFHALWFGLWVFSFIATGILQAELHRLHSLGKKHKRLRHTLCAKWLILIATIATLVSMSYTYPYATSRCSVLMYTIFVVTEYLIAFFNAIFYTITLYEFAAEFKYYRITAVRYGEEDGEKRSEGITTSVASTITI